MLNLIRSEWLKQTKRPLTWILLAVFLALFLLQFVGQIFSAQVSQVVFTNELQIAEYQRRVVFPGVFGTVFSNVNGLGGIFAVILAAGVVGSEYSWGTLRTYLGRYPSRVRYLAAKIVVVLVLLVLGMLANLALGALAAGIWALISGEYGTLPAASLLALPVAILRALYVLLPYVLLTICFAVVGRSLLLGVAGGIIYLVFEAGLGAAATFGRLGGLWLFVYNLTIGQNINTLVLENSHAFGLRPEYITPLMDPQTLPSPLQAVFVVAVYNAGFLATALHFFYHRDITGSA